MASGTNSSDLANGKSIAKNTLFNLLGYGTPLLFAIVIIPNLINSLGIERFGILSLCWMVLGYFSFLDLGIGRGLTKMVSELIGTNKLEKIPALFWTSLIFMFGFSFLFAIAFFIFVPALTYDIINISEHVQPESLSAFYLLSLSIPIVATTAALRGILESYQKFLVINVVRVFLGISTFLLPAIVVEITNSLFWIILVLIVVRLIVWFAYLLQCFKVNVEIKSKINFELSSFKPIFNFSIWISLANLLGPIIAYSDRFLISTVISAAEMTYYSTPYEVVSKLLLIPGALVTVLFPFFSSSYVRIPQLSEKIFLQGAKFIFLTIYPLVLLIVIFSFEGIEVWLGNEFANRSSLVLNFLAIGILMNSLSLIPNTYLQGAGKPKIPTLINLAELPLYIFFMWMAINEWGIKGAAFAYMLLAILDVCTMYLSARIFLKIKLITKYHAYSLLIFILILSVPFIINSLITKILFISVLLPLFIFFAWKYFLSAEEKLFLSSRIKSIVKI